MKDQRPLFTSTIRGRVFYIYSGVEDFLLGDNKKIKISADTSKGIFKVWTLIVNGDNVTRHDAGYPFFPSDDESPYGNIKHKIERTK